MHLTQLEGQLKRKADVSDLDRRPLKADVDASLKMQVSSAVLNFLLEPPIKGIHFILIGCNVSHALKVLCSLKKTTP